MRRVRMILSLFGVLGLLLGFLPLTLMAQEITSSSELSTPIAVRIFFQDQAHLNAVAGELDIWEVQREAGYAVAAVTPEQYRWLEELGYRLEVDAEKTEWLSPDAPLDGRFYYFDDYYTNPNGRYVVDFMQNTNTAYPNLTELIDIGDAWLAGHGGYHRDIWVLRITNEDPAFGPIENKPPFYLFATIHAREVAVPELTIRYIKYLTTGYDGEGGYGVDPDVTWMVDWNVIYVLVMQNPDGHVENEQNTSNYRRKNMDNDDGCSDPGSWGVDLNRNHNFFWGCCGGSSGQPCAETYRGPSRGSEPETQAFQAHFASVMTDSNGNNGDDELPPAAPDDAPGIFISLHSYADEILWPYGFSQGGAPNNAQLRTIARKIAYYNGFDPTGFLYTVDGSTDDWTYGKFGLASFTYEVGPSFGSCGGFFPDYECLEGEGGRPRNFWAENKPTFIFAHKIARTPYMTAYGPDTQNMAVSPDPVEQGVPVLLTANVADHRYSGDPLQPIYGAEYFVDEPGADGTGTPMSPSDGSWGDLSEDVEATVDTSGLSVGRHYILVHGLNDDGDWGPFTAVFLDVEPGYPDFVLDAFPAAHSVCKPDVVQSTIDVGSIGGYDQPVTLSDSGVPAGVNTSFSPNPVFPLPGSSTYTIDVTAGASDGVYDLVVQGSSPTITHQVTVTLAIDSAPPSGPTLVTPPDGALDVPVTNILFEWVTIPGAVSYHLQVDEDPAFGSPEVDVSGIPDTQYTAAGPLSPGTTYYWRVSATNACGEGSYATPFSFSTMDLCVLLVDDDDNSPDVRSYYENALGTLGYVYDVWNTDNSDNEPDAATLANYNIVIWFTGDEYGGYAGPGSAGESALGTYLDGGGNLLISSQDYYYDRGMTGFMGTYLGLSSVDSDVGQDVVSGAGSVYGGYGPYNLNYPFTNYSDEINPDGSAEVAFTGDAAPNAAIDKDSGIYKTTFWGFPWEALPSAADREAMLQVTIDWFGGCGCDAVSNADFDWTPPSPTVGEEVTFTGWATGSVPITYEWDFGDGNTGSGAIVMHTFDAAGDYSVVMTATNNCGQDTALHTVTVQPAACAPVEIVTVTTAISGCVVDFGAQLNGDPPYTYTWDFGAFGGSGDPNPTVDFGASGTYPYTLTVTNCEDTESDIYLGEVTVSCEPACAPVEIVTVTTAISGCVVDFGAQLNGDPPFTYTWDFGAFGGSGDPNPTVDFGASGTYPYTLTVTNCEDTESDTYVSEITVSCCDPVHDAAFSWFPMTPAVGEIVTFQGSAVGTEPIAFDWDFGDGSGGTGTTVTYTYAATGTYTVVMTASNDCGSDVVSDDLTVVLTPTCTPVEIVTVTTAISGCVVDFGAQLNGDSPFTYTWDFGGFGGSGDPNPTVDFGASGTYPYTLTVVNCEGEGEDTYVDEVTVSCEPPCDPVHDAAFSWFPVTPAVGEIVTFQGSAAGTEPIAYDWDFGDTGVGAGQMVTHTYAATGTFTVGMMASNDCGFDVVSEDLTVVLTPTCTPVEIVTVTTAISGCVVDFDAALYGDPPFTYTWDFGTFGGSGDPNPTVDFGASGTYPYTLTVDNTCGEDAWEDTVTVDCAPPPPSYEIYLPLVFKNVAP